MPTLDIHVDGDNCWTDLREHGFTVGKIVAVAALPNGTTEGNPTITFRIELPTGDVVLAETTLRLFGQAAAAFRGAYGEP